MEIPKIVKIRPCKVFEILKKIADEKREIFKRYFGIFSVRVSIYFWYKEFDFRGHFLVTISIIHHIYLRDLYTTPCDFDKNLVTLKAFSCI